ncbi:hypothetical protein BS50DRAFT_643837 [Corynespora cassiicola Philippines]|uniref:SAP domain-containing protein n=1 Tax=Corynespora cassiicola Philippines TaxID=1448308 RepID=A0A2T2PBW8_CORCC|nr:hypothetical protein BS50DRAFT_643837 [Corynespora cassiicola Philippines]
MPAAVLPFAFTLTTSPFLFKCALLPLSFLFPPAMEKYSKLSVASLIALSKTRDLPTTGTKIDLIGRLKAQDITFARELASTRDNVRYYSTVPGVYPHLPTWLSINTITMASSNTTPTAGYPAADAHNITVPGTGTCATNGLPNTHENATKKRRNRHNNRKTRGSAPLVALQSIASDTDTGIMSPIQSRSTAFIPSEYFHPAPEARYGAFINRKGDDYSAGTETQVQAKCEVVDKGEEEKGEDEVAIKSQDKDKDEGEDEGEVVNSNNDSRAAMAVVIFALFLATLFSLSGSELDIAEVGAMFELGLARPMMALAGGEEAALGSWVVFWGRVEGVWKAIQGKAGAWMYGG